MKPTYAICRTEKIKTWSVLTKSVGHNLRTSADERPHLDASSGGLRVLHGERDWVQKWHGQVDGMHLRKLQQGQAHTLAREFFLGMSPEWAEGKSKREIDAWAKANIDWLKRRFGEHRLKLAVLHTDEQTPHIAAYVVPLKQDPKGRGNGWTLSDRELGLGDKKDALVQLQDEYAEAMKQFDLARGVRGSKATHKRTAQWRREQQRAEVKPVKVPTPPEATLADRVNIEEYGQRVAKATAASVIDQMKPYHAAALNASKERAKLAKEVSALRHQVEKLQGLADAFRLLLQVLLGREPNLDTPEGLQEALGAATSLATDQANKRRQHQVQLAPTPATDPVQVPRVPRSTEPSRTRTGPRAS